MEIDTRRLHGDNGEILWSLEDGEHVITVLDRDGTARARLHAHDGTAALELFVHPFALAAVPNIFEPVPLG